MPCLPAEWIDEQHAAIAEQWQVIRLMWREIAGHWRALEEERHKAAPTIRPYGLPPRHQQPEGGPDVA